MSGDDSFEEFRQTPEGWTLEHELEIAAEVYGPEPKGLGEAMSQLSDEELVEHFKSLLGFDIEWE